MRIFKRMLALCGLTGLLAAMAAGSASAQVAATASCTVSGTANTSPGVGLTGGSGGYTFSGGVAGQSALQLNCLISGSAEGTGVATINVNSQGHYNNSVCGTGTADSSSNSVQSETDLAGSLNDAQIATDVSTKLGYHIQFAGTVGALTFNGGATGGGPIQISDPTPPTQAEIGAGVCTSDFAVTGALAGTL